MSTFDSAGARRRRRQIDVFARDRLGHSARLYASGRTTTVTGAGGAELAAITLRGRNAINRALDGDRVAIRLLPKALWVHPGALDDYDAAAPEATAALWERIDDVVMGGVSSSKIVVGDGGAEWRGIVRTDGGGFCGTRTAVSDSVESSFQTPSPRLTG